jgi:hypothetical protein
MVGNYHVKEVQLTYRRNCSKNTRGAVAVSMVATMIVAAILLSGLLLIGTYPSQLVLAQQENTMGSGGNSVTGRGGATNTTTIMLTTMDGGGGGAIVDGNATTVNMTEGLVAQGNDSMSLVRMHLKEARIALQNNDTQGALMNLDLALHALGSGNGNVSSVASGISTNVTIGTNVVAGDYIPAVVNAKPPLYASEASSANDDEDEDDADESDSNTDEEDSEGVREANDDEDEDDADESDSNTDEDSEGVREANDDEDEDDADESDSNTDEEDSECGAVSIGGTSPADDYGCPPDDDGA